jgi:hypothetical protein
MKEGIMEAVVAEEADFKILEIVKHPSKPVLWSVMIKLPSGAIHSVQIDTKSLLVFGRFQEAFFEKVFVMLPDVPWRAWRKMIASCKILDLSKYPTRKAD